jgi:hypothetical protein
MGYRVGLDRFESMFDIFWGSDQIETGQDRFLMGRV